jgi:hypothetical protein
MIPMPFQKRQMPLIDPAEGIKFFTPDTMDLAFAQYTGKHNTPLIVKGD